MRPDDTLASALLGPTQNFNDTERVVLDLIWRLGPITRQRVAEITGFTAMTVSRMTKSLTARALVVDAPEHSGARGNPTRPLSINPAAAYSVGVNFTQTFVEVGVIDLGGSIVHYEALRTDASDKESIGDSVRKVLTDVRGKDARRFARDKMIGVGFAVPGDFAERGRIVAAHDLFSDLRNRELAVEFSALLDAPVLINSDSNSAAVGERILGAGRNFETFLFVHLGHGVGGGLVLNGTPYFGTNLNAGIIGNHFPTDKPRPSGLDFLMALRQTGVDANDFVDLDRLDPFSIPETRTWIKRAGAQLRDKLNFAVKLIDPEAVIIGGRLPNQIHHALAVEIDRPDFCITCEMDKFLPRPRVIGSMLGSRAGVIGAAALPIYDLLFKHSGAAPRRAAQALGR